MKENTLKRPQILRERQDLTNWIISFLVISLVLFPFISAFNDMLTNWVISLKAYGVLTEIIVPQEIKWTVTVLRLIGINAQATKEYILIPDSDKSLIFEIIWNCIGWQSLVMFILTSVIAFSGKFSVFSKIKAVTLGIIGTLLINIFRIVFVIWLYSVVGGGIALIFHDYGALVLNTFWLIFFWSFAYSYILEE